MIMLLPRHLKMGTTSQSSFETCQGNAGRIEQNILIIISITINKPGQEVL